MSTWFRGRDTNALLEPGDTEQQWKGEAAASFVYAGITSSLALPTSSAGYWSPSNLCTTSASEAKGSFGGDFYCAEPLSPQVRYRLENTNSFPSGSLNFAMVPHTSFFGSWASSTPFDRSSSAVANTSSHQKVSG